MRKISYVIPCYRSEKTIQTVVHSIKNIMADSADNYEIVLVNDQSPDNVWQVITRLAQTEANVVGINLARNFGQHSALMAGYACAKGDIVVSMDDDGQTPVEEVYKLIDALDNGYDVMFAEYDSVKQNAFRRWGSRVNEVMTEYLADKPKHIKPTSFFAMKRFIVDEILRYQGSYPFVMGLIFRTTQNMGNVMVHHHERLEGKSGYTLKSLLKLWLNGFTAFSVKPLRLATYLGMLSAVVGVLYGIYLILRKIMVPGVPIGYSSLMVSILFIGGVIMMSLGIIGEYVGRIYMCINNAPQYVIKEIVKGE